MSASLDTTVEKDSKLMLMINANNEDAGKTFDPPRPTASSGWRSEHLKRWGYDQIDTAFSPGDT
jgi:hypothetical protein